MRTLFSVFGYGLGHATRCEAIMKSLKTKIKILASENAYDYFLKKGKNPVKINSFKIGNLMKSFSWSQTLFENVDFPFQILSDYNTIRKIVKDFKPEMIVSDSEPISLLYGSSSEITNCFITNITSIPNEYKKIPSALKNRKLDSQKSVIDLFINQVLKRSRFLISPTIKSYDMGAKVKCTDLIVRKKSKELPAPSVIKRKNKLPNDFILVSFGGAKITREYYKALIPVLKRLKQNFVISTNGEVKSKEDYGNVTLYPFIDNYLSFLKASKAIICLAGHSTISEALVYKKPCFVVPIQDHIEQLSNAVVVKDKGYGDSFFFKGEIKQSKLKQSVEGFINKIDDYKKNIISAKFKGNGDVEAANIIKRAF
jgi:uncharacterized protein (TIGR00661 family)